jgi:hypothetical protein
MKRKRVIRKIKSKPMDVKQKDEERLNGKVEQKSPLLSRVSVTP